MDKKRIGILELIGNNSKNRYDRIDDFVVKKQYVSLTPQAISVWCREMGLETYYGTFYGFGDPLRKIPGDLDIVFISAHTPLAPLAYALSKLYRMQGTRTVIGGPHSKSYPRDCQRYFDLVVLDCDQALIADIISDQYHPGSIISSAQGYTELPTVEARLPEIKASSFFKGRPYIGSFIPMLASVGCPYSCDFCIDWNSTYRVLSPDRLEEDLRFVSKHYPGVKLTFYDPNFGIRFDETMSVFERLPLGKRNQYLIESSLTNLNPKRLQRLQDTNCTTILPGIESWNQYSNKAGVGAATRTEKLEQVVEHFHMLREYFPYLQANFIMGLDVDYGDEPFELTKEFIRRAPFVWPFINIPMAFGGTPLFDTSLKDGRILRSMPFSFYIAPYTTLILKNYDPIYFFEKMIDLTQLITSKEQIRKRIKSSPNPVYKFVQSYRSSYIANHRLPMYQKTLEWLRTDPQFYAFHTGKTEVLPEVYARTYRQQLGKYAELIPLEESRPLLEPMPAKLTLPRAEAAPAAALNEPARDLRT